MRLLSIEIEGIKSINKKIKIDFFNKIIDKTIEENAAIKGIYGPNGAGKSAIVSAISIYKDITNFKGILNHDYIIDNCRNLICKKTNKLSVTTYLYDYNADTSIESRVKHSISINMVNGDPIISYESVSELDERLNEKLIFEQIDGIIKVNGIKSEEIAAMSINLLDKNSICSILLDKYVKIENEKERTKLFEDYLYYFVVVGVNLSINVCFGSRNDLLSARFFNHIVKKPSSIYKSAISSLLEDKKFYNDDFEFIVSDSNYKLFEATVKKMCKFIKVVKPELTEIKIDPKKDNEYKKCRLIFMYDKISVDLEYESTGIKKLVDLYETLSAGAQGYIAVIDEFDAGLHDVVMDKLIRYLAEETRGQFIFTTHNIAMLSYLKQYDHSIDFLSTDSVLTKWVKNGTSSPESVYVKGGIPHIPFNIDSLDFEGKF